MELKPLTGDQRRQLIDTQQVFEAWRVAKDENTRRFAGSMRWGQRNGKQYLLKKRRNTETSLGPRDENTEAAYGAFMRGRMENSDRLIGLSARLDQLALLNVAMGLGRVPNIVGRILRACDELLGEQLIVIGTNALFAYEVQAGVQLESGLIASGDIDLLYDARRRLSFAVKNLAPEGLIGLLKKADRSFTSRGYRASNRDGYLVDLIVPEAKDVFRDKLPTALSDASDDLEGAAVFGLSWLINSPKLEAIAIDDKGYPLRLAVIDPRAFAVHKAWLSKRDDREPVKAVRDLEQAKGAATIATRYLGKSFDSGDLMALPNALRVIAPTLAEPNAAKAATNPNW